MLRKTNVIQTAIYRRKIRSGFDDCKEGVGELRFRTLPTIDQQLFENLGDKLWRFLKARQPMAPMTTPSQFELLRHNSAFLWHRQGAARWVHRSAIRKRVVSGLRRWLRKDLAPKGQSIVIHSPGAARETDQLMSSGKDTLLVSQ